MTYVCSDIHGNFDRYNKAVSKLNEDDELIILGDVIDRGKYGIEILQDIMKRDNVHLIMGNHEFMMLDVLMELMNSSSTDNFKNSESLKLWLNPNNGGTITYSKLTSLDAEDAYNIMQFLLDLPLFIRLNVGDKSFHLSHASAHPKYRGTNTLKITDIDKENLDSDLTKLLWESPFDRYNYSDKDNYDLKNETYIVGHRPVQMFGTTEMISIKGKIFDIDGGCALLDKYDNNLILLCLDTMEEEYIN